MANTISYDDGSKKPYQAKQYADMRGVVDFGNLMQFAPYEKGYSFLAVINGVHFMDKETDDNRKDLQDAFIKILEQEFKGCDGIDDITTETMEISDNVTSLGLISKVNQITNNVITMRFTEKSGSLITKYVSTYLRYLRDPRTQVTTYGGLVTKQGGGYEREFHKEVFNMLYIVTDSTGLNVEKAFFFLNAQPTNAEYSTLYNSEKGDISTVEVSVPFQNFTIDGKYANDVAQKYIDAMICNNDKRDGKINVNSWNMDWSISGINGGVSKVSKLKVNTTGDGKLTV